MVSLDGTLTYRARSDGSPYSAINQARGTYTELPEEGDKVDCGDVLLSGGRPPGAAAVRRGPGLPRPAQEAMRATTSVSSTATCTSSATTPTGVDIDPDDNDFTSETEEALEKLQHDKGLTDRERLISMMRSSCPSRCGSPR